MGSLVSLARPILVANLLLIRVFWQVIYLNYKIGGCFSAFFFPFTNVEVGGII